MQITPELAQATGTQILIDLIRNRISRFVTGKDQPLERRKALMGMTYEDIKATRAWDDDLEALAATWLGKLPNLAKEAPAIYDDLKKQQLEWSKEKVDKPHAQL